MLPSPRRSLRLPTPLPEAELHRLAIITHPSGAVTDRRFPLPQADIDFRLLPPIEENFPRRNVPQLIRIAHINAELESRRITHPFCENLSPGPGLVRGRNNPRARSIKVNAPPPHVLQQPQTFDAGYVCRVNKIRFHQAAGSSHNTPVNQLDSPRLALGPVVTKLPLPSPPPKIHSDGTVRNQLLAVLNRQTELASDRSNFSVLPSEPDILANQTTSSDYSSRGSNACINLLGSSN